MEGTIVPGCFAKVIKINSDFPVLQDDIHKDAVGHAIKTGDRVFVLRPIEAWGNTIKGFILGGTVTKLTSKYVFYDDGSGMIRRKGYNGVVVPSGEQE